MKDEDYGEHPPLAGLVCEHGYGYDHVMYTKGKITGHCGPVTGPVQSHVTYETVDVMDVSSASDDHTKHIPVMRDEGDAQ